MMTSLGNIVFSLVFVETTLGTQTFRTFLFVLFEHTIKIFGHDF